MGMNCLYIFKNKIFSIYEHLSGAFMILIWSLRRQTTKIITVDGHIFSKFLTAHSDETTEKLQGAKNGKDLLYNRDVRWALYITSALRFFVCRTFAQVTLYAWKLYSL